MEVSSYMNAHENALSLFVQTNQKVLNVQSWAYFAKPHPHALYVNMQKEAIVSENW